MKLENVLVLILLPVVLILGTVKLSDKFGISAYLVGPERAAANAMRKMEKSVVMLTRPGKFGGGTGFLVITPKKEILTVSNAHVCDLAQDGYMLSHKDREYTNVRVKVLKLDYDNDLCLLSPSMGEGLSVSRRPVSRFDNVYGLGHGNLRPASPTSGFFTGETTDWLPFDTDSRGRCLHGSIKTDTAFGTFCLKLLTMADTTCQIFPGHSGSPAVNKDGDVVGVFNSFNGMGGAFIPVRYLNELLKEY